MKPNYLSLIAIIILCVGGGSLIGTQNLPGEWYANLTKPFFNPPSWLFGPAWTILYTMIGVAGWRTWMREIDGKGAMGGLMILWFAQLAVNFTWSPVFFTYHWMLFAAFIIVTMVVMTVIFIVKSWRKDRIASYLMMPYLGWICFATTLNVSLWWLNS